ncbi:MAG: hypothetical protein ACFE9L_01570 [Candidatus Hodarchaeota archaeon]
MNLATKSKYSSIFTFIIINIPILAYIYLLLFFSLLFIFIEYPYDDDIWKFLAEAVHLAEGGEIPLTLTLDDINWYPPIFSYFLSMIYILLPFDIYSTYKIFIFILMVFQGFAVYYFFKPIIPKIFPNHNFSFIWLNQVLTLVYFLLPSTGVLLGPLYALPLTLSISLFYLSIAYILYLETKREQPKIFSTIILSILLGLSFSSHLFTIPLSFIFLVLFKFSTKESIGINNNNHHFIVSYILGFQLALIIWIIPYNIIHGSLPLIDISILQSFNSPLLLVIISELFFLVLVTIISTISMQSKYRNMLIISLLAIIVLSGLVLDLIIQSIIRDSHIYANISFWNVYAYPLETEIFGLFSVTIENSFFASIIRWIYVFNPILIILVIFNIIADLKFLSVSKINIIIISFMLISISLIAGTRFIVFIYPIVTLAIIRGIQFFFEFIQELRVSIDTKKIFIIIISFLIIIQTGFNYSQLPVFVTREYPSKELRDIYFYINTNSIQKIYPNSIKDFYYLRANKIDVIHSNPWKSNTYITWIDLEIDYILFNSNSSNAGNWQAEISRSNVSLLIQKGFLYLYKL